MTWLEPERPRGFKAWIVEIIYGSLTLAAYIVGGLAMIVALFRMHTLPFVALCAIIVVAALVLIRWVNNDWFPFFAVALLGTTAFGLLWLGVALQTPFPGEAAAAIVGGPMFGLSSGATGSIKDRNLNLVGDRSNELRWAAITLIAVTVLFGVVVPQFPVWTAVVISGSMILSGLILTWRLPKVGSPHIAVAMLTAAGVVGCIVPLIDVVDSGGGRFLLASAFPWFVASAYKAADQWRDDRISGRKRWSHPATERAAQLRESGVNWDETLRTLEREGFSLADQVSAVRKLDRQTHYEATRFVKFHQHPLPSSEA